MVFRLLLLSVGVFLVGWLPLLPGWVFVVCLSLVMGLLLLFARLTSKSPRLKNLSYYAVFLLAGVSYGLYSGYQMLANQLPGNLTGQTFKVVGSVVGLPSVSSQSVRFEFQVKHAVDSRYVWLNRKKISLSWHWGANGEVAIPEPGQQWQLEVRLRRPRGFVNPYGFDYQRWLLSEGIAATGYVRNGGDNELISGNQYSLSHGRWQLRESNQQLELSSDVRALLVALTVGDRSLLPEDVWQQLTHAGVIHLLVISGLHIGLIALMGFWLGSGVGRLVVVCWKFGISHYWGSAFSITFAAGYAGLSGLGLPAQRALVMVAVANLMILMNRQLPPGYGFVLALLGVAVVDPLATHSGGFWLSFTAAAILLWLLPTLTEKQTDAVAKLKQLMRVQWLMFVGLFVVLMLWQLPQSIISPLVNFVAVPWISFLVVPLCLTAAMIQPFSTDGAEVLWCLGGWQLEIFMNLIASMPDTTLPTIVPGPVMTASLLVVAFLLLMPRGFPGKYLSVPLLAASLCTSVKSGFPLVITALDVGQGLAVVVRTAAHTLIYDTGPRYSERFDAGSGIVVPYLRGVGAGAPDVLIVSHNDLDHAGGVDGFLKHYQPQEILMGEVINSRDNRDNCYLGQRWEWDNVTFRVLHPEPGSSNKTSNNRSCVLLISYGNRHILLPGDIEREVEFVLLPRLKQMMDNNQLTMLMAPHHGSATSSSSAFVRAVRPEHVVFSAGFQHHFGHPHKNVVRRYLYQGTKQWNTAYSGALTFRWNEQGELFIDEQRVVARRYWFQ